MLRVYSGKYSTLTHFNVYVADDAATDDTLQPTTLPTTLPPPAHPPLLRHFRTHFCRTLPATLLHPNFFI